MLSRCLACSTISAHRPRTSVGYRVLCALDHISFVGCRPSGAPPCHVSHVLHITFLIIVRHYTGRTPDILAGGRTRVHLSFGPVACRAPLESDWLQAEMERGKVTAHARVRLACPRLLREGRMRNITVRCTPITNLA
eukprot:scaffold3076_cov117-Isochrysis_galbana.AAC.13